MVYYGNNLVTPGTLRTGGGTGASSLNDLNDCSVSQPANNDVLVYDSSENAFVNTPSYTLTKIPVETVTPQASVTIDPYKMYSFGTLSRSLTIVFNTSAEIQGYVAQYCFTFTCGTNGAITLPQTCLYNNGSAPELVAGRTYEFNISNNLVVVGEFY